MNEKKNIYEGCEKLADGRYRIHEKMTVTPIKCKEPITEKIIVEGKEVSPKRKYTFLVWNDEFNGNNRSYKYVIDRVIKENRPTFTLADHPQDGCDADSLRITGCGKNYRRVDGWLATDWYPLGEIGNRLADGFDLGVPATISSSVLGELDDDGYVMNNDSFFLERILDNLIDFPSNGIFHYADHNEKMDDDYSFETISENGFKESKENLTILNKENIVESSEKPQNDKTDDDENNDVIGENKMPENTMNDELLQTSMVLNIKSMLKDAEKLGNPFEKKEALVSADSFAKKLTDETLHNEISKKIEDAENEIKTLSTKGMQTDDLEEKVKKLEDENKNLSEELATVKAEKGSIEEKLNTITKMYEDKQFEASETEVEKVEELEEKNHNLSKELCSLKAKKRNFEMMMNRKVKITESKLRRANAELNTMADAETVIAQEKEIKALKATIKRLENEVDECNSKNKTLEAEINSTADVEDVVALKEKINMLTKKNTRLMRMVNSKKSEDEEEKKVSRFSQLRKSMEVEEEDNENSVEDIVNEDEITQEDVIAQTEIDEDDSDKVMEEMLNGTFGK